MNFYSDNLSVLISKGYLGVSKMNFSLIDHIECLGMSKQEFAGIVGRSVRTIERWNQRPPPWIIRFITIYISKDAYIPKNWQGWYFDTDGFLMDNTGNHYHIDEIRAIFWTRQLTRELMGSQSNILSLKQELKNKIKTINSEITLSWNDKSVVIDLNKLSG